MATATLSVPGGFLITGAEDMTNWTFNSGEPDSEDVKEGTYNLMGILTNTKADVDYTTSLDLSGGHIRWWYNTINGPRMSLKSAGGCQLKVTDGANTAYWNVLGGDTYLGGWYMIVVDLESSPSTGTVPSNLASCTEISLEHAFSIGPKNFDNCWIDALFCGDGYVITGGSSSDPITWDDVVVADELAGYGIVRRNSFTGVIYVNGHLTFGDSSGTNSCYFSDSSGEMIVFMDEEFVSSTLYGITITGNGTGSTEFILGQKTSGRGIKGCSIKSAGDHMFSFTATNSNIDKLLIYGSIFNNASTVDLPVDSSDREVIDCNFINCGKIDPDTCDFLYCNIIEPDTIGLYIDTASHGVSDASFIMGTTGSGVEVAISTGVDFTNFAFSGTDGVTVFDVVHSVAGVLTISNLGTNSNAQYVSETGGGSTNIETSYTLIVDVKDDSNATISGALVLIEENPDDAYDMATTTANSSVVNVGSSLGANTQGSGRITILDISNNEAHAYRYDSTDTTSFTLLTEITGSATAGATVSGLVDSGATFISDDIVRGDMIYNSVDGCWAEILEVKSDTEISHTTLRKGTDNNWGPTGDTYRIHKTVVGYTTDDKLSVQIVSEYTGITGRITSTYNYNTDQDIIVRIRASSGDSKYIPYNTSGVITGDYTLTAVLQNDEIA